MNRGILPGTFICVGVCCVVIMTAGCASKPTRESSTSNTAVDVPTPAALVGTEWMLEDLGGAGVIDNAQATLIFSKDFAADRRISGNGSCNRFTGSATVDAGMITVSPLATTRRACVPAVDDQEARYLRALQGAERLRFSGPYLLMYSNGMQKPLRFIKSGGG